jgi:transcriptional regulator with XRE-family HTH domain
MGGDGNRYTDIDQNIAANLRTYRDARSVSQEELAQRMAARGFGFTQATIWKIESGQRPVKASELAALADCFGEFTSTTDLTRAPEAVRHDARLRRTHTRAGHAYAELKKAAAAYLDAQIQLLYAHREARDAGVPVRQMYTAWLETPAEEAIIEVRMAEAYEDQHQEQLSARVGQVIDALRSTGYEPLLRVDDIKYSGDQPVPEQTENA